MPEPTPTPESSSQGAIEASAASPGPVSTWLSQQGFEHENLGPDHLGVEVLGIEAAVLPLVVTALNQLIRLGSLAEQVGALPTGAPLAAELRPDEVRLKVSVPREGNPSIPSLYGLFHGADWQERETFDMFGITYEGHPHPKRLLMPEDWKGWPLRKDYVQPDFYEMQDAY
jgi:NAD(P)H-quinone oxidoreductase subunit J